MKKTVWIITSIVLGVALISVVIFALMSAHDHNKKVEFLNQYLPEKATMMVLLYSDKYDLDWIKVLALLYAESEGKQKARSRNRNGTGDYGYMQLNGGGTLQHLRQRLKRHIDNVDKYSIEFNVAGGCLHLRAMLNYVDNNYYKAVEIYNIGIGGYRRGKTNDNHLDKWMIYYNYFRYEYLHFINPIRKRKLKKYKVLK